jgi:hypothetical protein
MRCKPCCVAIDMIVEMREANPNYLGSSRVKSVDGDLESIDDRELFYRTAITLHSICKKNCDCNHNVNMDGKTRDEDPEQAPRKSAS